ncbi:MAG: hypothetical protein FWD84_06075 [Oscillospiraceae bacterium]|nr:hypothetical protein [Oscillospiraceae bacterium]
MKKWIVLIFAVLFIVSLAACGDNYEDSHGTINAETGLEGNDDPNDDYDDRETTIDNSDRYLDFKSVQDTETGIIFTLGDPRSVFEDVLGLGEERALIWGIHSSLGIRFEEVGTFERYAFASGSLIVEFFNDRAMSIVASSDRFSFVELSFDMTVDELREQFPLFPGFDGDYYNTVYGRSYDVNGNVLAPGSLIRDVYSRGELSVSDGAVVRLSLVWFYVFREIQELIEMHE